MPRVRNTRSALTKPEDFKETKPSKALDALPRQKQPLQDITDRFAPDAADYHHVPTPRPKRRAKAPIGTLGQRLKARHAPSSLPPSSPIPSSSQFPDSLPTITSDFADQYGGGGGQFDHEEDEDNLDFDNEHYGDDDDENMNPQLSPSKDIANLSDPFGFFAVEKKIKAERILPKPQPRYRGQPPPRIITVDDPEERLEMPPRPHKQRVGKRPAAGSPGRSSAGVFSPRSGSMPSTPSPVKTSTASRKSVARHHGAYQSPQESDLEGADEGSADVVTDHDDVDSPAAAVKERRKPRGSGRPVQPVKLANSLKALLPKRPVRKAAAASGASNRGRGKTSKAESEDEDAQVVKKKVTKKTKTTGRKKAKKGDEEEIDVDVDEVSSSASNVCRLHPLTGLFCRNGRRSVRLDWNISRSWRATVWRKKMSTSFEPCSQALWPIPIRSTVLHPRQCVPLCRVDCYSHIFLYQRFRGITRVNCNSPCAAAPISLTGAFD